MKARDEILVTLTPPSVQLELRPAGICGIGVFAVCDIETGRKVCDGISYEDFEELVPWETFGSYDVDLQQKILAFCVGTPVGFVAPPDFDFNKLSIEWYLNHSCEGNIGFNEDGDFIAISDIRKGDELSYDYGLVESNPRFSMKCACGSATCRHVITGNDWKNEDFFVKNWANMHPRLRRQVSLAPRNDVTKHLGRL